MSIRTARIIRMRRKRRLKKSGNASRVARWVTFGLSSMGILVVLGVLGVVGTMFATYLYYARDLPKPTEIEVLQAESFKTTVLYDRTGQNILYEVIPPIEGDRQNASIHELPQYFLDATVAIEDASFYTNPGFNVRGIGRALWANMTGGQIQGGSSITQQLVKNVMLREEERTDLSVDRKIKELILASEISRLYSKDQILEWYVNTNFYGNLAYGIEAASRVYFNKRARDLTLSEATLLAAIPQFPGLNPLDDPVEAKRRQQIVLDRMVALGYLTQPEADAALAEPIVISPLSNRFDIRAPHFSIYALNEAERLLNQQGYDGAYLISRGGLRIYTTLDLDLQEQLECVARTHVMRLGGSPVDLVHNTSQGTPCTAANYLPTPSPELQGVPRSVTNAAGVILNPDTGEIRAMLGSVDYWNEGIDGNFNVATAERQPGSVFKPLVYIAAFVNPLNATTPITAATMTYDVQTEFTDIGREPYIPRNIDNQYHGPVSVRDALANSYNVPVVQVLNWIGLAPVIRVAHRMGINSLDDGLTSYGLSLALGAGEVTLLDITYAYNVINQQGYMVGTPVHVTQARQGYRQLDPVSILRIEDVDGDVLWDFSQERGTFDRRFIIEPAITYIMTDILADNEARHDAFPPGNPMELSRPAAVKTGTTDDNRDSWTIGYTPQYTTGIWVGNNDSGSMTDITGISGAAPIWHAIMEYVHARDQLPVEIWERPDTVVEQRVCRWSGLLPTQNCQQVPAELFYVDAINGIDYSPQRIDDQWYRLPIDKCTNTRANDTTPPECVEEKLFFNFPDALIPWAEANAKELIPPDTGTIITEGSQFGPVALVSPRAPDRVSGAVEVFGSTRVDDLHYYTLGYGQGNTPTNFIQLGERGEAADFNHLLAEWDTTDLQDGIYTLRLQVVYGENNEVETTSTRVTVDNTPPEVRLIEPLEAATYSAQEDVFVTLMAEVFDSYEIQRVEFYIDGTDEENPQANGILIDISTEFPYQALWQIEGSGLRTFWAVAYDSAGNSTESRRVIINVTDEE